MNNISFMDKDGVKTHVKYVVDTVNGDYISIIQNYESTHFYLSDVPQIAGIIVQVADKNDVV